MSTPSLEERRNLMQSITDILTGMGYREACKRADGIYYERHVDGVHGVRLNSAKIGVSADNGLTSNSRIALFNHFGLEGVGCIFHGSPQEFIERYSAPPQPVVKRLSTTIRKLTHG